MKRILQLSALLALGAALATQAGAAFESIKFDSDNRMPMFPVALVGEGITRGQAIIAISVSAEGKLTDWLVLGYTQKSLAQSCIEALKQWKMSPARLDGEPVPVQARLTFNFTVDGAVISFNVINHFLYDRYAALGDGRLEYRVHNAGEIDRVPARVSTPAPLYAAEAEKQGVRGKVLVHFYIDEQGVVRLPSVEAGAHPYLSEQAVAAVREWRFEPPTRYGRPVLIAASQEFDFSAK
jgi:TonB family protein